MLLDKEANYQMLRPAFFQYLSDTFNAKLRGWETMISLLCGDSKAPGV